MRILHYAEAVEAISAPSEYLNALNTINIYARGAPDMPALLYQRRRSVIDMYAPMNMQYRRVLLRLCNLYIKYAKYTRYTGIIMTDGTDECGASHCYGNNIVLSRGMFSDIHHLLPHEIWHIISRQLTSAELHKIYSLYNIYPTHFSVPIELRNVILVNPDNMAIQYAHECVGNMYVVLPTIQNNELFGNTYVAGIRNGVMYTLNEYDARHIREYISMRCGTTYITGADEIIADNFADYYTGKITPLNQQLVREYIGPLVTNMYYV